ncbi:xanthine dehydrogenase isoform X2 [Nilaparvata lugens]|uniref:xanthine dehydrogenase isoform X2 n=1 Tax=Nilaparvata lugens TaxID=108931 RepID=UPI00193DF7A4|nr:xanthine dehydrogenase isoform X2 [Nilaparvata lugens]
MSPPGGSWSKGDEEDAQPPENKKVSENEVAFKINGKEYRASGLPIYITLNTFIRDHANLKGTKYMCEEGGCGACIVAATIPNPQTGKSTTIAVNSCLTPIYNCHGWAVETVEALGSSSKGFGKIQSRLASNNGTQCGYCSPGMVMNMYSLLQENKGISMSEVENSFGGNICRCTGYRPILDSFKSLAKDASKELVKKCVDIEELSVICPRTKEECLASCGNSCDRSIDPLLDESRLKLETNDGKNWYRVKSVKELFEILEMVDDGSYMLVGGNTSYGVYRPTRDINHFIDIKGVRELIVTSESNDSLTLGANLSLTNTMIFFNSVSKSKSELFGYTKQMADHIDLIASVPVRNTGTLAGNLSIKHQHRDFPSDVFLIFETVGARLNIADTMGLERTLPIEEFLKNDMNKKVIKSIALQPLSSSWYTFKTYKIMPRAQNAHAYVNAGFLFKLDKNDKFKVLEKPRIVFGGINPNFVHAELTEAFLEGKYLSDSKVMAEALKTLDGELKPNHVLPDATPEYRKGLAVSLLYKFILSVLGLPDGVSPNMKTGGASMSRPVSTASQSFQTDKSLWPLNQPINKLEAFAQCSGEAQYVNDIPSHPGELHAAVVIAKQATAKSFILNPEKALRMDGVVSFFTAKDIPGRNDCMSRIMFPTFVNEEILASEKILHAGQALGVIVAKSRAIALKAAEQVEVVYKDVAPPVLDFIEVIKSQDNKRIAEKDKIERKTKKDDVKHKVSGTFEIGAQYHYTMETQTCLCIPLEDGMDVYPSTQWPSMIQWTVADVLNVQQNTINVKVKRLGGAYGSKISRNNQISALCALCAHLLQRPVRLNLSLETNMQMMGKRFPCYINYEAAVNNDGKIQYLDAKLYQDIGARENESDIVSSTLAFMPSTYDTETWSVTGYSVKTDTPANTWCRSPGSTEGVAMVEHIMDHIASIVKKDPVAVRLQNFRTEADPVKPMIDEIKASSDYQKAVAEVEEFNNENRWKKQGLSLVPLAYPLGYFGRYHANISIFSGDGTVAISHGGVECGQGINTKAAQVCAHILGIPLDLVKVKSTQSLISPNDSTTGGSVTSEAVCYAVKKGCEELNSRLQPYKEKMPKADWKTMIQAAVNGDVDLNCNFMYKRNKDLESYLIFGVTVMRVEVDILTGQHQIVRTDIMEDAGQSMSPEVDVGQVEGAFVMGLGYYLHEQLVYDKQTGKLLTDRTWNYKPPGSKDIPANFHVTLVKNSRNPLGVLRSKEMPLTCENIWLHGSTHVKDMTL